VTKEKKERTGRTNTKKKQMTAWMITVSSNPSLLFFSLLIKHYWLFLVRKLRQKSPR
jgi:hypothetical protein